MIETSKTQDMVLKALGLSASSYGQAEKMFEEHGIIVASKRVGRSVQPEIRMRETSGGGFIAGEGSSYDINYKPLDTEKIKQWIKID